MNLSNIQHNIFHHTLISLDICSGAVCAFFTGYSFTNGTRGLQSQRSFEALEAFFTFTFYQLQLGL